jgi:very-short-patch-repair endonuclease
MDRAMADELLALASTQLSLITIKQAAAIGITPPMLRAAIHSGWVHQERRGVLVVAGAPPSRWRRVMAATLAGGPGATVSHTTAAVMHRFYGVVSDEIELTFPASHRRNLQGVRVHRSATLQACDIELRHGVAVTGPIRTLIDVAGRFKEPLLGLILDEGAIARLWTPEAISARMDDARRGAAGASELRRLLAERTGEGNPDSRLEQRVIRAIKREFPGYTVHHRVVLDGDVIEMDIAWVDEKIDGEVDGMQTRSASRTKFERTSRRSNILNRHGWRIVHFTDKMDDNMLIAQVAPYFRPSTEL